jgi:hypothetical protein
MRRAQISMRGVRRRFGIAIGSTIEILQCIYPHAGFVCVLKAANIACDGARSMHGE